MPSAVTLSIVGSMLLGALLAGADTIVPPATRTIYVSAFDKKGNAVTDLQPHEFELKIAGKQQAIVGAERATTPLRIAVLVADAGTGGFQLGLARFMQKLLGQAEFSLTSVIVQPQQLIDYSTDAGALTAALRRLGTRGREGGAQLMEAIRDATVNVRSETKRPVIVVMRVGSERPTELSGNNVRDELRRSGAILYVVSTLGAQRPAPPQARGTDPVSVQQGQLRDSELADSAFNLALVLGDGSRESGGRHEQVVSATLVPVLEQVADELLHQYEISYVLSDGAKPHDKIAVSSRRKGVTVRAPSRLPS